VLPAPEGGYLRRSNFRRRWWLRATRAAGVEGLRFHGLRHSAAALALAAGANNRELMERLGHTSPQVALRYQHVMAGRDQAIAAALDELVQAARRQPAAGAPGREAEGHASGTKPAREGWPPAPVGGGGPLIPQPHLRYGGRFLRASQGWRRKHTPCAIPLEPQRGSS
jgi:hypothetical protein